MDYQIDDVSKGNLQIFSSNSARFQMILGLVIGNYVQKFKRIRPLFGSNIGTFYEKK